MSKEPIDEFVSPAARRAMRGGRDTAPRNRNPHALRPDTHHSRQPRAVSRAGGQYSTTGGPYSPHRRRTPRETPIITRYGLRKRLFGRKVKRWLQGFVNKLGLPYSHTKLRGSQKIQGEKHHVKKGVGKYHSTAASNNARQRSIRIQHVKKLKEANSAMTNSILAKILEAKSKNVKPLDTSIVKHPSHVIKGVDGAKPQEIEISDSNVIITSKAVTTNNRTAAKPNAGIRIQEHKSLAATIRDLNNKNNK